MLLLLNFSETNFAASKLTSHSMNLDIAIIVSTELFSISSYLKKIK